MTNPAAQPAMPDAAPNEAATTAPTRSTVAGTRLDRLVQNLHLRFNLLTRIGAAVLIIALWLALAAYLASHKPAEASPAGGAPKR